MPLPDIEQGLVIRTDFSAEDAWDAVRARVERCLITEKPDGEISGLVHFVDDDSYSGLTAQAASDLVEQSSAHQIVYLADKVTMSADEEDLTLLAVMSEHVRRDFDWNFRLRPETIAQVQVMLEAAPPVTEPVRQVHDGVYRY